MAHITLATAYLADDYATPAPTTPGGLQAHAFKFTNSVALVINDLLKLSMLAPGNSPGFVLFGFVIEVPALDSSTGLLIDIGDSTSATRYVASSVVGRSSTNGRISSFDALSTTGVLSGTLPVTYTAQDDLVLKIHTAASGTPTTGGLITGAIYYQQLGLSSL